MKAAAEGVKFQFARALSTVFWVGYFPVAPGTVASAVALLLFVFCLFFNSRPCLPQECFFRR